MKKKLLLFSLSLSYIIGYTQTTSLNDHFILDIEDDIIAEWGAPVFEDNFTSFNSNDWTSVRTHENVYDSYYTLNNVAISNQRLVLKAEKEDTYVSSHNKFYNMTVSEIWTQGDLGGSINGNNNDGKFQYGYFEISAKLARGKGMHSSFWLFGSSSGEGHEIDVFEASHFGKPPNGNPYADKGNPGTGNQHTTHFGTNVHRFRDLDGNGDSKGTDENLTYSHHFGIPNLNNGVLSDGFNKYAVEWTPYEITWYYNNREIRSIKSDELLSELGIGNFHPMRLILALDYDNRLDQGSPNESQMEIEYIRVYQKDTYKEKPDITGNTVVCKSSSNMRFDASNYQIGDSFKWEIIDGNGYIYSNDNDKPYAYVNFYSRKRTMALRLTITDLAGNSSSRTIVITNRRDPYFFIDQNTCSSSTGKISLKLLANTYNSGSEWSIYKCDVDGNIIGDMIDRGWGTNTYTFNNLEGNTYYRIFHGVWEDNCSDWSQASRVYQTSLLRSFDIKDIIKYPSYYKFSATAHSDTQSTNHYWAIYNSNSGSTIGSQVGTTQWTSSVNFSNLNYGHYYLIKHGVWSSCNSWRESRRLIYIPSYIESATINQLIAEPEQNSVSINVFPNPASETISIISDNNIEDIYLHTIGGQLIQHYKPKSEKATIDCNHLQNGKYILLIINKDFTKTKKLIIVR